MKAANGLRLGNIHGYNGTNDIETGSTFEKRRWTRETLQTLRFLVGMGPLLLLFFVILVIAFNFLLPRYLPPEWIIEAPLVLLVLNTLFLSIIPFVVALIALRSYTEGGSADLLFLGCGMLSFSSACFVAGWLGAQAQANFNITIHNTGVLLASVFNLLAGITLYLRKSARRDGEKQNRAGIYVYLGILIFTGGLSFATLRGYTPAFSVSGSGPTLLREVVLMTATIFFGASCLLIVIFDRDRRSFFLSCYALALGLITIGLIALMTYKRTNTPLAWLGRSAQYAAGIYFLAAVVAAVRTAWANRWTVRDTVRDFLRPSEALYRDLVEATTDAIVPISTSGEILLWNTAAEHMFGYKRMETFNLAPSDLIDSEDSKRLFREIEAGVTRGKGSFVGELWEVKARRKSGEQFPAELSFSSRRLGGGWVSTLIIRDITERKRAEEEFRRYHDELEMRIQERTEELQTTNEALKAENEERLRVEIELRESEGQLRQLSAALIGAQERERKVIAGEIHDAIGSSLAATKFKVESVAKEMGDGNPQARDVLESVIPILQGTIEEARRIQMSLRPSMLDDLGILATVNWFCRQFQETYSNIRIKREIDIQEDEIPKFLKIAIYRVLQEALNNIAKHSKALTVVLSLRKAEQKIQLVIRDSGHGFNLEEAYSRKGTTKGLGLDSMRERIELSGGSFSIESSKGAGTVIRATWLLNS